MDKVFKRIECANPNCKKTFLVLVNKKELTETHDPVFDYPIIVCGGEKPNCKRRYEESIRPEIKVVE